VANGVGLIAQVALFFFGGHSDDGEDKAGQRGESVKDGAATL
jgi:hypothetical protein